ncbi:TonB-dependent receptor [Xinfangfangia sp. CPCC 101601]|uniref:TonB-dependent receptor n=1 Tax=Pseudogemmobacter lacusdianii TaxID=3069608 RepID=A0ABU0W1L3_9RHOB|nr:TonB-dependent receptor [Xinfangfangia sp. CPCC 101601]MDQ2067866.1 TonB-dependent receptor [Xinfangfangia sp. CPCC 101601]
MSSRRISHARAHLSSSAWQLRGQIPALSLAFTAGISTSALAQSVGETEYLGQIVITASGFEQLLKDAPASISVISGEELQKGDFSSLTDALKGVQGVVVTGVANETDIFIRGLSGAYTLILVDGKRQSTRDARTNGNAGFEQSFVPPVSAIERIEVVRGPMSSLYGSDAMGGVVNIITKKVGDVWGGEVTVDATVNPGDDYGDKQQLSFYLNGPIVTDRLGLQIWGRAMQRDAATVVGGMNGSDERDLNVRLSWTPDDNQDVMFEAGRTNLKNEPLAGSSYSDNSRDHLSLTHIGRWAIGTSEVSLSKEWAERTGFTQNPTGWAEGARSPEIANTVLDAKLNTQLGAQTQHNLTFGGQVIRADLTDQNPGMLTGLDEKFRADQWALFVEDEWQLTDSFALTGGLRFNDHSEYDGHFTPRLYGVWTASDALTIKGGVSTGFRAPDIRSIAPGYAYTTGGGNCRTTQTCGVIIADPNLSPETTTSYELAMVYDKGPMQFGATIFQTNFKDKIENYRLYDDAGNPVPWLEGPQYTAADGSLQYYDTFYNRNVQSARIRGLELTFDWTIVDDLQMRANYTYTDSKQKTGEYAGFPLTRTPEHMASLRFDWDTPLEGLSAWASGNYHGSEIAAGLRLGSNGTPVTIGDATGRKYAGYTTVDLGADYAINDSVNISFAVYNALDHEVNNIDSNTVVEGRRAWLSLTKRF